MINEIKEFTFQGLNIKIFSHVYEPAEDTFQLLDSIKIEKGKNLLDIGAGCGIISFYFAKQGIDVLSTDINPHAVKNIQKNYENNKNKIIGSFEVREGDLFKPLKKEEIFDVIIFNPPYLPTKKEEIFIEDKWLNLALNGGKDGLKYTEKFISNISKHLKKDGISYFVFSSLSDREKLENILKKNNFSHNVVSSIRYNSEKIDIYKIKKKND